MGMMKKLAIAAVSMLAVAGLSQTFMYIYSDGVPVASEKVSDIDSVGFSNDGENVNLYKGKTIKKSVKVSKADSISFNPFISITEYLEIKETDKNVSLGFECEPEGHVSPVDIEWISTNEDVVKVKAGVVTPVSPGSCVVYAEFGYQRLACEVVVSAVTVELNEGNQIDIKAGKDDKDIKSYLTFGILYKNSNIEFESRDSKIVSIEDGRFVGESDGETIVDVLADGKKIGEIKVDVSIPFVLLSDEYKMEQGETVPASDFYKLGRKYSSASVTYKSSDESVVVVKDGAIEGVGDGVAEVSVLADGEILGRLTVDVNKSIDILQDVVMIDEGEDVALDKIFVLGHRFEKTVLTYKITDQEIAAVSDGKVKGLKDGVSTITVFADGAVLGSFDVDVNKTIVLSEETIKMDVNDKVNLSDLYTLGHRLKSAVIIYRIDNKKVADENDGVLTGIADGVTTISIMANGTTIASMDVDVNKTIDILADSVLMDVDDTKSLSEIFVLGHRLKGSEITYNISNTNVATVKGGVVNGLADGVSVITVVADGSSLGSFTVDVNKTISFTTETLMIDVDETSVLSDLYVLGHRLNKSVITYNIADKSVVSEDNGTIKGLKDGVTSVSILADGNEIGALKVDVNKTIAYASDETLLIDAGQTAVLSDLYTLGHRYGKSEITYTVADSKVVTVENGVLTGVGDGITTVSILADAKEVGSISVDVNMPLIPKVSSLMLTVGESETLSSLYTIGHRYTPSDISYEVDDDKVVSVSGGKITGLSDGITILSISDGKETTKITVDVDEKIVIKNAVVEIESGETVVLSGLYKLGHRYEKSEITYTVADSKVATVENGVATGVGDGTTTVNILVDGEKFGSLAIDVDQAIVLKSDKVLIDVEETSDLKTVFTVGHRHKMADVAYKVADDKVATVSAAGVVTGIADGITTVEITVDGKSTEVTVDVNKTIEYKSETVEVEAGKTADLSAFYVLGHRYNGSKIAYTVASSAIATVEDGVVTGVADGTTTVNILADGEKVGSLAIDVDQAIVLKGDKVLIDVEETSDLKTIFTVGHRHKMADVAYKVADDKVSTVSAAGVVTGITDGITTVEITVDGKSAEVTLDVNKTIEYKSETVEVESGETADITSEYKLGHRYKGAKVTYTTSDAKIATVDADGVVTGVADGIATISILADGESVGEIRVDVNQSLIVLTDLVRIDAGKTYTLINAYKLGHRYANSEITYTSSDEDVATVAGSVLTGVDDGVIKVNVFADNVKIGEINVDVNKPITIINENLKIEVGETSDLSNLYKLGHRYKGLDITYKLSDETKASISGDEVTGVADGIADISIWVDKEELGTIHLDVNKDIILKSDSLLIDVGEVKTLSELYTLGHNFNATNLVFELANTDFASIADGKITGLADGSTIMSISYDNKVLATMIVDVNKTITLKQETIFIDKDATDVLKNYYTLGHRHTDDVMTYQVVKPEIASVKDGVVTGLADGITNVVIIANGEEVATIKVDVDELIVIEAEELKVDVDATAKVTNFYKLGHRHNGTMTMTYEIADNTFATISGEVVTGIADGVTSLTIKGDGNELGTLVVDVNKTIEYINQLVEVDADKTVDLSEYYVLGHRFKGKNISYKVQDQALATIKGDVLTGVVDGTSKITIYSNQTIVGTLNLDVNKPVTLKVDTVWLDKNQTRSLSDIYVLGHKYKNATITFALTDENIVSLTGTTLRGLADGVTKVKVLADGEEVTQFVVDVNEPLIMNVTGNITLIADVDIYRMLDYCTVGHRYTEKVSYRSQDESVITVNSKGRVKGLVETSNPVKIEVIIGGEVLGTVSFVIQSAFVDLELPSQTLWATCNVGSTTPEGTGNYYAWGETKTKRTYTEANYEYAGKTLADLQADGIVEPNGNLYLQYDIANKVLGNMYRMPTKAQIQELVSYCYISTTTLNNVAVLEFRSKANNEKVIYIPLAGQYTDSWNEKDEKAYCWSASYFDVSYYGAGDKAAYVLNSNKVTYNDWYKGNTIRPVANIVRYSIKVKDENKTQNLVVGEEVDITSGITIMPDTALYEFRTNNSNVAVAENGVITATGVGVCKVYVNVVGQEDKVDSVSVTVKSMNECGVLVDLGLPSGTLWSSCNLGATTISGSGDFYAWGETTPKTEFVTDSYAWKELDSKDAYRTAGVTDANDNLNLVYDPVYQNLGLRYRMPTRDQITEFVENCNYKSTVINGQKGRLYTSRKNGNMIFIPAAGYYSGTTHQNDGTRINVWTSILTSSYYSEVPNACASNIPYEGVYSNSDVTMFEPSYGLPVRPVSYFYITIDDTLRLSEGVSKKVTVKVSPNDSEYTLTTSDRLIATVSEDGIVRMTGVGECKIYATVVGQDDIKDSCIVITSENGACGFVDLGLPSGTKWATCNIGAGSPEEYGDYFAWGELLPRKITDYTSHPWNGMTNTDLANNGYIDVNGNLTWKHDAAFNYNGNGYGIPTKEQWQELIENCDFEAATINGVSGKLLTSKKNGKTIFLPNAGFVYDEYGYGSSKSSLIGAGERLDYTTSTFGTESGYSIGLSFSEGGWYGSYGFNLGNSYITTGLPVRPVQRTIEIKPIDIIQPSVELLYKDNAQLAVTVWPETEQYYFISSDEEVATVDATGLVTPHKIGTCTITATIYGKDELKDECEVTVYAPTITWEKDKKTLLIGSYMFKNEVTVSPSNLQFTITSSNNNIVGEDWSYSGRYVARDNGDCQMIATITGYEEIKAVCNVSSRSVLINFDSDTIRMTANTVKTPSVSVNTSNYGSDSYTVKSLDNSIVYVTSDGLLRAVSEGECRLVAVSDNCDICTDTCVVVVSPSECSFVDLGLPSGTMWATCNIGASNPTEDGDYFFWGKTYAFIENESDFVCGNTLSLKDEGIVDDDGNLIWKYDAAFAYMGNGYAMPTLDQVKELVDEVNTEQEEVTVNGVKGIKFTSLKNGNSIFFPYSGGKRRGYGGSVLGKNVSGTYLTSSSTSNSGNVSVLDIYDGESDWDVMECREAYTIRPVQKTVVIKPIDIQQIRFDLLYKDNAQLTITVDGNETYELRSSDNSVATVDQNGLVECHAPGECMIIANVTGYLDVADTCYFYVSSPSVEIKERNVRMSSYDEKTVTVVKSDDNTVCGYSSSSNTDLVFYNNKLFTEHAPDGNYYAVVYIKGYEEISDTVFVKVVEAIADFGTDTLEVPCKATKTLDIKVSYGYKYTLSSDNYSVAEIISNNTIRTVAKGTCNIIASIDGTDLKDTLVLNVVDSECLFVDLGLPSGTKWSSCNVGAFSPEEIGDYFVWGSVVPKENINITGNLSDLIAAGYIDANGNLTALYDPAYNTNGEEYSMPTMAQFNELIANTTSELVEFRGTRCIKFTSTVNDNFIYIPLGGLYTSGSVMTSGEYFNYWTSTATNSEAYVAFRDNNSGEISTSALSRYYGTPVRPVMSNGITPVVSLDKSQLSLYTEDTESLKVNVVPNGATYTLSSTNSAVATVSANGTVTAVAAGECDIIAEMDGQNGVIATCHVVVKNRTLTLDKTNISLVVGDNAVIEATTDPNNVGYEVTTTDDKVVALSGGGFGFGKYLFRAVGAGECDLKFTMNGRDDVYAICHVVVVAAAIDIEEEEVEIPIFGTKNITVNVRPDGTTYTFASTNENVATVSSTGKITPVAAGQCKVFATVDGTNIKDSVIVKVTDAPASISVSPKTLKLRPNDSYPLETTVDPTSVEYTYTTTNANVATVSEYGVVKAVADGECDIKVTVDGKSDTYDICHVKVQSFDLTIPAPIKNLIMAPGSKQVVSASISPSSSLNYTITSTDENVVTCSDHKIIAVGAGECMVVAKIDGYNIYDTCFVKVVEISLDKKNIDIFKGGTAQLTATVNPSMSYSFESSNLAIANVTSDGLVSTSNSTGSCKITAYIDAKKTIKDECTVNVIYYNIDITNNNPVAVLGKTFAVPMVVTPDTASVEYTVFDTDIAEISSTGVITPKKEGTTFVICSVKADPNVNAMVTLSVTERANPYSVEFGTKSYDLAKGESVELDADIYPSGSKVSYESSDWTVAFANDNGKLFALGEGTCRISATMDGHPEATDTIDVTVFDYSVDIVEEEVNLNVGDTKKLSVSVHPSTKNVVYTSSDENIATVSSDGTITAVADGSCKITVVIEGRPTYSDFCTVKVGNASIDIEEEFLLMKPNESKKLNTTVSPNGKSIVYSSDWNEIASVSADGTVTATGRDGQINVRAAVDGIPSVNDSCLVVVYNSINVNIVDEKVKLLEYRGYSLNYNSSVDRAYTRFESSDETVATVDEKGYVIAQTTGKCRITYSVIGREDAVDSCFVTVYEDCRTCSMSFTNSNITINNGTVFDNPLVLNPVDMKCTLVSSDPTVATVSADGKITAVGVGTCKITAETDDYYLEPAVCNVTVVAGSTVSKFVDLDLPSGTKWATMNVGASSPEDFGDRFAWGEVATKNTYTNSNCETNGKDEYELEDDGYVLYDEQEDIYYLKPEYDAAAVNESGCVMPTKAQMEELLDNCDAEWTTLNGVNGYMFTSYNNGNTIFFPASGIQEDEYGWGTGEGWHASYLTSVPKRNDAAYVLYFSEQNEASVTDRERFMGSSVRPVFSLSYNVVLNKPSVTVLVGQTQDIDYTITPDTAKVIFTSSDANVATVSDDGVVTGVSSGRCNITIKFVSSSKSVVCPVTVKSSDKLNLIDLGLPSGTRWAESNIGAELSSDNGNTYSWGDTEPSSWGVSNSTYNKTKDELKSMGVIDDNDNITSDYDPARKILGDEYSMPTKAQFDELVSNCTVNTKSVNGVVGFEFVGSNGKSIFIPGSATVWSATVKSDKTAYIYSGMNSGNFESATMAIYYPMQIRAVGAPLNMVVFDVKNIEIANGATKKLVYTAPSSLTYTFSSSDENIATVSADGTVTAVSVGECTITVTTVGSGETDECKVTVVSLSAGNFIDLGLPSGTLWSEYNLGAMSITETGSYYAWGETSTKSSYEENEYWYMDIDDLRDAGVIDQNNNLTPSHDAVTAALGSDYRTPTVNQYQELIDKCWSKTETIDGVQVIKFTSTVNGNSVYFPRYTGYYSGSDLSNTGDAFYASSTAYNDNSIVVMDANYSWRYHYSYEGYTVRPVTNNANADKYYTVSIYDNDKSVTLKEGQETSLNVTVKPTALNPVRSYVSSDITVATVSSNGIIRAVADGECDIIVSVDGIGKSSDTCHVVVSGKAVYAVNFYYPTIEMYENSSEQSNPVNVTKDGGWAPYDEFSCTFTLSDEDVLDVTPGSYNAVAIITPKKAGECVITATLDKDPTKTAVCTVRVVAVPEAFINMGLPSGTFWASSNVGATYPSENGDSFVWGSVSYSYDSPFTGVSIEEMQNNGIIDVNGNLNQEYDAAFVKKGSDYSMPTAVQMQELVDNCDIERTTFVGEDVYKLTSKLNGNVLYLSASEGGRYWTSTADVDGSYAYRLSESINTFSRNNRCLIRPVKMSARPFDIRESSLNIIPGEGVSLTVYNPDTQNSVTYTSSDLSVATVSVDGVVTGVALGNCTITASSNGVSDECTVNVVSSGASNGFVDLGLPTGTLWADKNIGAVSPEETGGYYAWGEVDSKDEYTRNNSVVYNKDKSELEDLGFVMFSGKLLPSHDVAYATSSNYRMPSNTHFNELISGCTVKKTTLNGVTGYKFTSKSNGNCIFLPSSGYKVESSLWEEASSYWSSDYSSTYPNNLRISDNGVSVTYSSSYYGYAVRPIYYNTTGISIDVDQTDIVMGKYDEMDLNVTVTPSNMSYKIVASDYDLVYIDGGHIWSDSQTGECKLYVYVDGWDEIYKVVNLTIGSKANFVDLGLPSGILWADMNIGASSEEDAGNYYAWGETEPKDEYFAGNCQNRYREAYDGTVRFTWYGYDQYRLDESEDVSSITYGSDYRTPTVVDFNELKWYTSHYEDMVNGVVGMRFSGNGNSIFIPYAGMKYGVDIQDGGSFAYLWSGQIQYDGESNCMVIDSNNKNDMITHDSKQQRYLGMPIRAVKGALVIPEGQK